jgi:hypothetical protein
MLFTLAHARPRLEEIFRAWFDRQDLLQPVFARYFYLTHNAGMPTEVQFESYIRALETYHRRGTGATDVPPDEHEARIDAILASAPAEHREWLNKKLAFSNEPPLGRRLKDTLARCPASRAVS